MASLPSTTTRRTTLDERWDSAVLKAIRKGYSSSDIAKKLGKGNPRKEKVIRARVRRAIARSDEYRQAVALEAQGVMAENLVPITEAMIKRGLRGRTDAAKLAFEASGFHNPRVKHEHSGDIKITLDIPRPVAGPGKSNEDQRPAELDIPEVDVVEE